MNKEISYVKICEVYCTRCGEYCYQESNEGMCEDCYEDYLDDLEEDED